MSEGKCTFCKSSFSHVFKGGGDSPTLALPMGPKPRKPLILVRLFWFVELTPRRDDANCLNELQMARPKKELLDSRL